MWHDYHWEMDPASPMTGSIIREYLLDCHWPHLGMVVSLEVSSSSSTIHISTNLTDSPFQFPPLHFAMSRSPLSGHHSVVMDGTVHLTCSLNFLADILISFSDSGRSTHSFALSSVTFTRLRRVGLAHGEGWTTFRVSNERDG